MATPYITIGCPTTGGGKVISGNSLFQIDGIPVACTGDKATCPTHKVLATIVSGDPNMNIFGKMAARAGDSLSCGCKLLPQQNLVVQDNGGAVQGSQASNATQDSFMPQADEHGIKFQLKDQETGKPLAQQYFKLKGPDGSEIEGFTDENGFTELIKTGTEAKEIDLTTFDLSQPMAKWE
ncbi:PAAR motif family protein [Acinetobacter baumannii 16553_8]|uniref:PAAR domain-containing protein n=1 Tax=Acinetobacter baumannii TaxID=470 RepID=UPI00044993D5|nr:PAAR domain-containing protein [Acinetobacter baumannii]KCY90306.1 PAAR motif family protein [Acinetobacter baumannii 929679-598]EHU2779321.1 PAAR domain-containing protein [Acinetobacter baumannii]EYS52201.1 PAAR motif family protein [Acinetobacter baumannii 16553_10]EYS55762.1 PAAR motif family protein [Acinetobacter baumannii 16553_9]EYS60057.1 PAAR motif family protein [Acinetobacter baumannii 16553_8]